MAEKTKLAGKHKVPSKAFLPDPLIMPLVWVGLGLGFVLSVPLTPPLSVMLGPWLEEF